MSALLRSAVFALILAFAAVYALVGSRPAAAMDFELATLSFDGKCKKHCPDVMVATGTMDLGTMNGFVTFAQGAAAKGASNVLIIDSPGGHLIEGLRLGLMLRRLKTTVFVGRVVERNGAVFAVNGSCMSACVYALMGGRKRFVTLGSLVGVHREMLPNSTGNDPQSVLRSAQRFPKIAAMLVDYSRKMGVDPALIALAEEYGAGGIRMLSPEDIARFRLARVAR